MKVFVGKFAEYINISLCLSFSFLAMVKKFFVIKSAEVFVLMPEGGFGHTITGPDDVRRFFQNRKCVFIAFSEFGRHNAKVSNIWPDISIIFLPLSLGAQISDRIIALSFASWYKKSAPNLMIKLIRLINSSCDICFMKDVYERIPLPEEFNVAQSKPKHFAEASHAWPIAYFKLQRDVSARKVCVPQKWSRIIRKRIDDLLPSTIAPNKRKLCCLYLRQKGEGSFDGSSFSRAGSDLIDYIKAIRLLNGSNYQVLLTGDISIPKSIINEFKGMLVDFKTLRVSKHWFYLFAATESDIFIGESGGGTWLPTLNDIPTLIVNAFPYGYGLPNSWVFYKTVRDKDGNLLSYEKLFNEHLYQYNFNGMSLNNNNDGEIYNAVSCFIESILNPDYDPGADVVSKLSNYTWIKQARAKLSPAWLKLYSM